MAEYTDEQLAAFATPRWVDNVAAVPLNEAAVMIAEDPSVLTALVGAVRHARARVAELERERDEARSKIDWWEKHAKMMARAADTEK